MHARGAYQAAAVGMYLVDSLEKPLIILCPDQRRPARPRVVAAGRNLQAVAHK